MPEVGPVCASVTHKSAWTPTCWSRRLRSIAGVNRSPGPPLQALLGPLLRLCKPAHPKQPHVGSSTY